METESSEQRRTLVGDGTSFRAEQTKLGGLWTFLGLLRDVPKEGDWFRARLGGRSIFVQRFETGVRAFANTCAHRHYPLRTQDRGNGPVRCGFHHWQYDSDGLAVGIPKCIEQFGMSPRELGKRLESVEIAHCGELIFGRFPNGERHSEPLKDYLREGFPILQAAFTSDSQVLQSSIPARANWKFGYQISLDDYHIVAVHPSTFGQHGYLKPESVQYFRFGRHSTYFHDAFGEALAVMARDCRNGTYAPTDYRIFQFFPNLILVHFEAAGRWYVLLQQYVPLAADQSALRCWLAPARFGAIKHLPWRRAIEPLITQVVMHYIRKIGREDNAICEQLQRTAHEIRTPPIYGRHEQRIAWFEQTYAEAISDATAAGVLPETDRVTSAAPDRLLAGESH